MGEGGGGGVAAAGQRKSNANFLDAAKRTPSELPWVPEVSSSRPDDNSLRMIT